MKFFKDLLPVLYFFLTLLILFLVDSVLNSSISFSKVDNYASLLQVISTFVLVVITGVYAYFTYGMVKEMRGTRMDQFLPMLSITISPHSKGRSLFGLHNLGNGPARDIVAKCGDIFTLHFDQIEQGHYNTAPLEHSGNFDFQKFLKLNENDRKVEIRYSDIFGRNYLTNAVLYTTKDPESGKEKIYTRMWKATLPIS